MTDICNSCVHFNKCLDNDPYKSRGESRECMMWEQAKSTRTCLTSVHGTKYLDGHPCGDYVGSESNINNGDYWKGRKL